MRKVRITWLWREYNTYYQIDGGENLGSLEMVVAELNDDIEEKMTEQGELTEKYRAAVTQDTIEIYSKMQETNEIEYRGHTIKRTIDREDCTDTQDISYNRFPDKLSFAMSWVTQDFLPMYEQGFDVVKKDNIPEGVVFHTELKNKNSENPNDYVSTFLRGLIVEILK